MSLPTAGGWKEMSFKGPAQTIPGFCDPLVQVLSSMLANHSNLKILDTLEIIYMYKTWL